MSESENSGSRRIKKVISQRPSECFKKEETINSIKHYRKVEKNKA